MKETRVLKTTAPWDWHHTSHLGCLLKRQPSLPPPLEHFASRRQLQHWAIPPAPDICLCRPFLSPLSLSTRDSAYEAPLTGNWRKLANSLSNQLCSGVLLWVGRLSSSSSRVSSISAVSREQKESSYSSGLFCLVGIIRRISSPLSFVRLVRQPTAHTDTDAHLLPSDRVWIFFSVYTFTLPYSSVLTSFPSTHTSFLDHNWKGTSLCLQERQSTCTRALARAVAVTSPSSMALTWAPSPDWR